MSRTALTGCALWRGPSSIKLRKMGIVIVARNERGGKGQSSKNRDGREDKIYFARRVGRN
jgi:hypothetical protein